MKARCQQAKLLGETGEGGVEEPFQAVKLPRLDGSDRWLQLQQTRRKRFLNSAHYAHAVGYTK